MDEDITKAIEILNEDIREPSLNGQILTDQSSKVTDAPKNCGDGILQMMPGTSAKAKRDLAAKVKQSRKKISEALTLRHSLHRESKTKAKESIRNLLLIKLRHNTISIDSKPSTSRSRVSTGARKKNKDSPPRKRKGKRVRKDVKPILFVTKSNTTTSQSKSTIGSFESGPSRDDISATGVWDDVASSLCV